MGALTLFEIGVAAEWVDYNGHMNDAAYGLPFSRATDGLMERIGLGPDGRARTGHSLFTLAAHTRFLHEARLGDRLLVAGQLLAHDAKKLVVFLDMRRGGDGLLLATSEQLMLCVDLSGAAPRSAPFPSEVRAALAALAAEHSALPRPAAAGQGISLDRRGT